MTLLISRKPTVFILAVILLLSASSLAVSAAKIVADGVSIGASPSAVDDFLSSGTSKTYVISVNSSSVIDWKQEDWVSYPPG
jgi:hypothetical protein